MKRNLQVVRGIRNTKKNPKPVDPLDQKRKNYSTNPSYISLTPFQKDIVDMSTCPPTEVQLLSDMEKLYKDIQKEENLDEGGAFAFCLLVGFKTLEYYDMRKSAIDHITSTGLKMTEN
jgi:hypothetical protein